MPPKKKGKKGKNKAKKEPLVPPMKNVIRTFYELEIADIKKKIERLQNCGEENIQLEKELDYLIENRTDDLGKKYYQLREETTLMEETEDECNKIIQEHKEFLEQHHQEMLQKDCEFVRMVEEHKGNVRIKKSELVQFEQFSHNSEAMLNRFQNDEKKYLEREAKQKLQLEKMELNLQSYKEQVKQDVDRKLLKQSEQFVDKCKKTIPKHTQRLIHENIALNNELDRINNTNLKLQSNVDNALQIKSREAELQNLNRELVTECHHNLGQIMSLLKSIEGLEYVKPEYITVKSIINTFEKLATQKIRELENYQFDVNLLRRNVHGITVERANCQYDLRLEKLKYEKYLELKKNTEWHLEMLKNFDHQNAQNEPPCYYDEKTFQTYTRANVRQQLLDILEKVQYIEDPLLMKVDSVDSVSKVYDRPNYGGFLDRADFDTYEDDVPIKIESQEEYPRKGIRSKKLEAEEEVILPIFDLQRTESVESVHSAILIDVEVDDSEFFFEPSDAELSEVEEDEADEENYNYSSSD